MHQVSKTCALVLFIILSIQGILHAQTTISGMVTDAETGETVPGVNVYLANTMNGSATNKDGRYEIKTNQTGVFDLVFSFIGYESVVKSIKLTRNASISIDVNLEPGIYDLEELQVSGSNKNWKRNFEAFWDQFIGKTKFAEDTIIKNPAVINFSSGEDSNTLVANAPEPLIIINNALGYRLYVELEEFTWSRSGNTGYYKIYPKFELLTPEDDDQQKDWERNREKAYERSFGRFMKSLYDNNLEDNNFTITNLSKIIPLEESEKRFELLGRPGGSSDKVAVLKGYKLMEDLRVNYGRTSEYKGARAGNSPFDNNISVLTPNMEDKIFFIDNNGNLLNPVSILVKGYWGQFRVADQLPSGYEAE